MSFRIIILFGFTAVIALTSNAQTSGINQEESLSVQPVVSIKYIDQVTNSTKKINSKLEQISDKMLGKLKAREEKIYKKFAKIDSLKASQLLSNTEQQYKSLQDKWKKGTSVIKQYIPSLDSLGGSLKFLQENQQLLSTVKDAKQKLIDASTKIKELQENFEKAADIKEFLKGRKEYLKQQLNKLGFTKQLKKLNKQLYYYGEQINDFKALLKDHKKAERKALELLSKTKFFGDFMKKNSMLSSLFRLPGDPSDPSYMASLTSLQTRIQVNNLVQQQITAGGPNAQAQFQQNVQAAQTQLNQLKSKITQLGSASSDDIMPEGFKPNNQKAKSFLKRLEYGTNIQTQKAQSYFPVTSDIGLSVGYKINDKSIIGIGASYKIGLGTGWRNISITQQGAGVRSYVDWHLKKSFWISGGYEMNYKSLFNSISQLRDLNAWQRSGLIGVSKKISLKTKFFKQTSLQLLWDFLSYQQLPRTQPVIFRIGYSLK